MELSDRDKEMLLFSARQHALLMRKLIESGGNLDMSDEMRLEIETMFSKDFFVRMNDFMKRYTPSDEDTKIFRDAFAQAKRICDSKEEKLDFIADMIELGIKIEHLPNKSTPSEDERLGYIQ